MVMRRRDFILTGAMSLAPLQRAQAAVAAKAFMSLGYSPSRVVSFAELMRGFTSVHIGADLRRIAPLTRAIRTYTTDLGIDAALPAAKDLGLKVSLGFGLGSDNAKNEEEIARGLKAVASYGAIIDRVYVGNETLQRKELNAGELTAYVRRVRGAIASQSIKVGTGENWHDWLKAPELAAASDFIGAHIYPSTDGVPAEVAVDYVARRVAELRSAFPGKPVIISETGWPSAGPKNQAAVPSPENQERFIATFLSRAANERWDYSFFEAYDQPWKDEGREVGVGPHWGLFDGLRPKVKIAKG
jgi:exo-beta-1,3-glucanase (GH17 family)